MGSIDRTITSIAIAELSSLNYSFWNRGEAVEICRYHVSFYEQARFKF